MKNLKNLGKALSKAEQKTIIGGKRQSLENGYQCCNTWGCGACVQGSSRDCSIYDHGSNYHVWGQSCTV